jgi:hypothetical protein
MNRGRHTSGTMRLATHDMSIALTLLVLDRASAAGQVGPLERLLERLPSLVERFKDEGVVESSSA